MTLARSYTAQVGRKFSLTCQTNGSQARRVAWILVDVYGFSAVLQDVTKEELRVFKSWWYKHISRSAGLQDVTTEELRVRVTSRWYNTSATVEYCRMWQQKSYEFVSRLDDTTHPPQWSTAGCDNRRVASSCHVLMIQHMRHSGVLQDVTTEELRVRVTSWWYNTSATVENCRMWQQKSYGSCHVLMIQHMRHSAGLQDVTTEELRFLLRLDDTTHPLQYDSSRVLPEILSPQTKI